MKTIYIAIIGLCCLTRISGATDDNPHICLPNREIIGTPIHANIRLFQTDYSDGAIQPFGSGLLFSENRIIGVTAKYRKKNVSFTAALAAVTDYLEREPDSTFGNAAYWNISRTGSDQVTGSVSYQGGIIDITFAEHPVMPDNSENKSTEQSGPGYPPQGVGSPDP